VLIEQFHGLTVNGWGEVGVAALWSNREGVFSHETALSLHQLSDALPARIHLTLPLSWQRRRLKVPRVLILHYADIPESDRAWYGAVPVTTPERTINDCAVAHSQPQFIRQAIDQGLRRGLFDRKAVASAEANVAIYRCGRQSHPSLSAGLGYPTEKLLVRSKPAVRWASPAHRKSLARPD
jgi:predicted transcriptional regulator of viral defense system